MGFPGKIILDAAQFPDSRVPARSRRQRVFPMQSFNRLRRIVDRASPVARVDQVADPQKSAGRRGGPGPPPKMARGIPPPSVPPFYPTPLRPEFDRVAYNNALLDTLSGCRCASSLGDMIDAAADSSRMPPTIYIRRREDARGAFLSRCLVLLSLVLSFSPSSLSIPSSARATLLPPLLPNARLLAGANRAAERHSYTEIRVHERARRHFHNIQM